MIIFGGVGSAVLTRFYFPRAVWNFVYFTFHNLFLKLVFHTNKIWLVIKEYICNKRKKISSSSICLLIDLFYSFNFSTVFKKVHFQAFFGYLHVESLIFSWNLWYSYGISDILRESLKFLGNSQN